MESDVFHENIPEGKAVAAPPFKETVAEKVQEPPSGSVTQLENATVQ